MAIQKNITIDGIDVPFKASAAVPRLYRLKFCRDIYQDFAALQKSVGENTEESSALDIESLEVFENIAYIMAKHADPSIPDSPERRKYNPTSMPQARTEKMNCLRDSPKNILSV